MNRMPPKIHNHHARNSFFRDFNPESIRQLEKSIQKEIFEERAHYSMVLRKKPKTIEQELIDKEEENQREQPEQEEAE